MSLLFHSTYLIRTREPTTKQYSMLFVVSIRTGVESFRVGGKEKRGHLSDYRSETREEQARGQ